MSGIGQPYSLSVCARSLERRRAATLIELLVVMAMIGLLISILIPSLRRSMDLAADTICKHNLREIHNSLEMYRNENFGWFPVPPPVDSPVKAVEETRPWFVNLYPTYLPNPMLLTCPEDPFSYRMATAGVHLEDPSLGDYSSYGLNSFIMTAGGGFLANVDRYQPSRPHDTMLAADLGPDDATGGDAVSSGFGGPVRNSSLLAWDDGFDPIRGSPNRPWLTKRHGHGINVLTLGGGIREARTAEVMKRPMRRYYESCASAGCTFCREFRLAHYSFAQDHLYWWTGPVPAE